MGRPDPDLQMFFADLKNHPQTTHQQNLALSKEMYDAREEMVQLSFQTLTGLNMFCTEYGRLQEVYKRRSDSKKKRLFLGRKMRQNYEGLVEKVDLIRRGRAVQNGHYSPKRVQAQQKLESLVEQGVPIELFPLSKHVHGCLKNCLDEITLFQFRIEQNTRYNRTIQKQFDQYIKDLRTSQRMAVPALEAYVTKYARLGDKYILARNEFSQGNLRLVVSIAKKFQHKGLSLLDLCQEGFRGLMYSVDKFDHRRKLHFSTFGAWMIKRKIKSALLHQSTVYVPCHAKMRLAQAQKNQETLQHQLMSQVSVQEADEQGILRIDGDSSWAPVSTGFKDTVIDPDIESSYTFEPVLDKKSHALAKSISDTLTMLSQKEEFVIIHRYGLLGASELTLEEIGKKMKLTKERVRQIESDALAQFRHPLYARKLEQFLPSR